MPGKVHAFRAASSRGGQAAEWPKQGQPQIRLRELVVHSRGMLRTAIAWLSGNILPEAEDLQAGTPPSGPLVAHRVTQRVIILGCLPLYSLEKQGVPFSARERMGFESPLGRHTNAFPMWGTHGSPAKL